LKSSNIFAEIEARIEPGPHNPAVSWLNCNHYSGKNALQPGTFCKGHRRGAAKVLAVLTRMANFFPDFFAGKNFPEIIFAGNNIFVNATSFCARKFQPSKYYFTRIFVFHKEPKLNSSESSFFYGFPDAWH